MAKYEVVFSELADTDLDKIKKFYARQIVSRIETVLLQTKGRECYAKPRKETQRIRDALSLESGRLPDFLSSSIKQGYYSQDSV